MIDESCGKEAEEADVKYQKQTGVRTRVMDSLMLNTLGMLPGGPVQRISELGSILRYCMSGFYSTKRRTTVDVPKLVEQWIEAIVGMCSAHSKDEYDAHDAMADKLLTPLLSAPVAQIREFYAALRERMEKDTRVPFLVHITFEAWGECVVKNAPDEAVRKLKRKLAADIVELVEKPVKEQLPEAIRRALCWRDPETLKEVKVALEAGAKPKLVGRQSCLFLECKPKGRNKKPISVMV